MIASTPSLNASSRLVRTLGHLPPDLLSGYMVVARLAIRTVAAHLCPDTFLLVRP